MARGNEKFIRRQKEVARQKAQEEKRQKRASKKDGTQRSAGEDEIAAIQAAVDAGLKPGAPPGDSAAPESADGGEDDSGEA